MPQKNKNLQKVMLNRLINVEQPSAAGAKKEFLKPKSFKESLVRGVSDATNWLSTLVDLPDSWNYALVPEDIPYLRQYLHPEKDILPRQSLRPTMGKIPEGDVVRRTNVPDEGRTIIYENGDIVSRKPDVMPVRVMRSTWQGDRTDTKDLSGLGQYNATTARDDRGEFLSVLDRWDFDTAPTPIRQIMGLMGTPFSVYDKFDIEGEIPNVDYKRRKE